WCRVGATFAALMAFLAQPVWEGYPGAAGRVLLPMTLAFNILVPTVRRWLVLLIAGNLTVVAGFKEFTPPREFYSVTAPGEILADVKVTPSGGWYGGENDGGLRWRWSREVAALRVRNDSDSPLAVTFDGQVASALDERRLRV